VYPIFFTVLSAPFVYLFGSNYLNLCFSIFIILILWILKKYWNFNFLFLYIVLLFGIYHHYIFYSEINPLIFFGLLSITFLKDMESKKNFFLAGIILGIGVWIKHEAFIFFGSLALSIFIVHLKDFRKAFGLVFSFTSGFGLIVTFFFLFNWYDYGNILGPRVINTYNSESFSFLERFKIFMTLCFIGNNKPGFFAYYPWLFPVLFVLFKKFNSLKDSEKLILLSNVIFILLVGISAPNDGVTGPRY